MKLDKVRFATLIGFISRAAGVTFSVSEIVEIDDIIDMPIPEVPQGRADATAVDELLKQISNPDGFISAIKAYRALTGSGLKEAKEAVERYRVIPKFRSNEPATLGDILATASKS